MGNTAYHEFIASDMEQPQAIGQNESIFLILIHSQTQLPCGKYPVLKEWVRF